mmetsp:Transcript_3887/g.8674  ORF Transcript_3887/g.8674 Transcript_3887/m.8674 type:complete len:88 (+) Transcript_3887:349-612(+)
MLKSFSFKSPTIDQREQFKVLAIVNGRGIDTADFVSITSFKAASGLAKRTTYIKTASFPMISAAFVFDMLNTTNKFAKIIHETMSLC